MSIHFVTILQCFSDNFSSANYLIGKKNTHCKADEIAQMK